MNESSPIHEHWSDRVPTNSPLERRAGDLMRQAPPFLQGRDDHRMSAFFRALNGGFSSIAVDFKKGDQIKIREGPFESFEGTVEAIDQDRGIVKVIVEIFGRSTPLDIEYWQIEKA